MSVQHTALEGSQGRPLEDRRESGLRFQDGVKRCFDIVFSLIALVLILPLIGILGVIVKLTSPGPVFYRGWRAGRHGRPFRICKLRTMVADAEKRGGAETAADDPRITRFGGWLRRSKADEFPQLLNVLAGEMSFVGPRPEVLDEVERYTEQERLLLQVRPGITDWASVEFRWEQELLRGSADPHAAYHQRIRPDKIRLGLQYVRQRSFLVDLQILVATLSALFASRPKTTEVIEISKVPRKNEALAVAGGAPLRERSFPPWPSFSQAQIDAAIAVLQSGRVNYWTGTEGRSFEREFAAYTGRKYGIALANGTVALELALRILGIGPGDEVVVPSRTFIATASSVVAVGAIPVCADVDRASQNLTAGTVRDVLSPRTRAIIAVHLAGWPCEMGPIMSLARDAGLKVVEDCAQAHGARYNGRVVGSLGDAAAFSFCQDKILTTAGEGGMLVVDDEQLWARAWSYKDHGKNVSTLKNRPGTGFQWVHHSFGTNWRLSEVQAAVGRVQLRSLDDQLRQRRRNAGILNRELARIEGVRVAEAPGHIEHAYYKCYGFVRPELLADGWDRNRVVQAIVAEGVPCSSGSCSEIYLERAFTPDLRPKQRFETARELGDTSMMFQVHPTLSEHDMRDTAAAVRKVLAVASKKNTRTVRAAV